MAAMLAERAERIAGRRILKTSTPNPLKKDGDWGGFLDPLILAHRRMIRSSLVGTATHAVVKPAAAAVPKALQGWFWVNFRMSAIHQAPFFISDQT